MNLSVCTITFRHQLISIAEIAKWSVANGFQGIELWGAHATNLEDQPEYGKEWLSSYALKTSMLSDYLPLFEGNDALYFKVHRLCRLAKHWGGNQDSHICWQRRQRSHTRRPKKPAFRAVTTCL